MLETSPMGAELRALRMERGLSLTDAAARAGISKAALSQWENWYRVPSGAALEKLLQTYKADYRTTARLLTAADPLYAKNALLENPLGPAIDIGEVLKGMRLRSQLTQAELARRLGLVQSSVAKWETGESRPSPESLQMALAALNASAPEINAIYSSKFKLNDETDREQRIIQTHDPSLPFALREVALILLQYEFWHDAVQSDGYDRAYQQVLYTRGSWYKAAYRNAEAIAMYRKALALAKEAGDWENACLAAVHLSECAMESVPNSESDDFAVNRARILKKWLDRPLTGLKRAEFLCRFLGFEGRNDLDSHERISNELFDLLAGRRSSRTLYPYYGIEHAIEALANNHLLRGFHANAVDTLRQAPGFVEKGFYSTAGLSRCMLSLMIDRQEFAPEAIESIDGWIAEVVERKGETLWFRACKLGIDRWRQTGKFRWPDASDVP